MLGALRLRLGRSPFDLFLLSTTFGRTQGCRVLTVAGRRLYWRLRLGRSPFDLFLLSTTFGRT
jgi:hypothetical protein